MAVSQKVRRFMEEGGWIRRVFEEGLALKAQIGADKVFDLSLGNPVMEPPQEFQDELRRLANAPLCTATCQTPATWRLGKPWQTH